MPTAQARRVRQVLTRYGLTQVALARRLGVTAKYVNDLVAGRKGVTLRISEGFRDALGVSPTWLIWGDGPMDADAAERRLGEGGLAEARLREAVGLVEDAFGAQAADVPVDPAELRSAVEEVVTAYVARRRGWLRLGVTERAAANPETVVAFEPVEPPRVVELPLENVTWIEIDEDSMDPVLRPGQIAGVLPAPPEDGDLAIIELADGRQMFKRWVEGDRRRVLLESASGRERTMLVLRRDIRRARRVLLGVYL